MRIDSGNNGFRLIVQNMAETKDLPNEVCQAILTVPTSATIHWDDKGKIDWEKMFETSRLENSEILMEIYDWPT